MAYTFTQHMRNATLQKYAHTQHTRIFARASHVHCLGGYARTLMCRMLALLFNTSVTSPQRRIVGRSSAVKYAITTHTHTLTYACIPPVHEQYHRDTCATSLILTQFSVWIIKTSNFRIVPNPQRPSQQSTKMPTQLRHTHTHVLSRHQHIFASSRMRARMPPLTHCVHSQSNPISTIIAGVHKTHAHPGSVTRRIGMCRVVWRISADTRSNGVVIT